MSYKILQVLKITALRSFFIKNFLETGQEIHENVIVFPKKFLRTTRSWWV